MPGDDNGISIPLGLFSSLDTEIFPPPEGISPDNSDCIYNPQSVGSREGLHKILSAAIPGNPRILYHKTFVQLSGNPLTLVLDANGGFWKEDIAVSPGVLTSIGNVSPTTKMAKSVTAFGKEYIAFSDGLHATSVPLQYDGTNVDRVSQDGPALAPTVVDEPTFVTRASPIGLLSNEFVNIAASPNGLSHSGGIVTVTIAAGLTIAEGFLLPGDPVTIAGAGIGGYNGNFNVLAVLSSTQFQYSLAGALANSGNGTARTALAQIFGNPFPASLPTTGTKIVIAGAGVVAYNGTWFARNTGLGFFALLNDTTILANSGGATISVLGQISVGVHQAVLLFQTRTGYITAPSRPVVWAAAGSLRVSISNLAIGPPNVTARIIAFTGAGGDNFFYIPVPLTLVDPVTGVKSVIASTVIADNTSTSATLDFSDNALFGATAIDIPGRNYFANVVLGPCLGFFHYASRTFGFGEFNKVQNFLNMGFEGGYLASAPTFPLGWSFETAGGALITGGASGIFSAGQAYQITGDGTANDIGRISQSCYQDGNGVVILKAGTSFSVRAWASLGNTPPTGTLRFDIYSASFGTALAVAFLPLTGFTIEGNFQNAVFTSPTPTVMPTDAVLRICGQGLFNGLKVTIDEIEVYPTAIPFRTNLARGSYVNAPEQFDGVTGDIGPANDTTGIYAFAEVRGTLYLNTADGKHGVQDNGTGEPSTWNVEEVTQAVGTMGVHCSDSGRQGSGDSGEQFEVFASLGGLYIFSGGTPLKISQEVQGIWNRLTRGAQWLTWVKNDPIGRRCYIGMPLDGSFTVNKLLVLDYNNLDDAAAIANTGPIREGMSGKLVCREFSRKWSLWNLALDCGEMLFQQNTFQPCFGGHFGNYYYLDEAKLTDDDYGIIAAYYTTYPFGTSDQEQQLQLSRHKLATYLSANLLGTGLASIIPYSNVLTNQYPELPRYPLSATQDHDLEWDMNVDGERIGLRIGSVPGNGPAAVASVIVTGGGGTGNVATFTFAAPVSILPSSVFTIGFSYSGSNPSFTGTWIFDNTLSPTQVQATGEGIFPTIGDISTGGIAIIVNQTDNKFVLQGLNLGLKSNPWSPVRGAF